jgi:hypothetical protein
VFTDFHTHGVEFLLLETMITLLPEYLDYKVDAIQQCFASLAAEAQIIKSEGHESSEPGYRFQQCRGIKASVVPLAPKLSRLQGAQEVKPRSF